MLIEVPDDADEHYIFSKAGGGRVVIEKTGYRKIDLESVILLSGAKNEKRKKVKRIVNG